MGSLFALCLLFFLHCKKENTTAPPFEWAVPKGFPQPVIPEENAITEARVLLGKKLFFDPVLSRDSSISCGTCHKPEFAFADDKPTTPGVENRPGKRNAPSLLNVAYQNRLLREGGVMTLEMQVLVPIAEANEFDNNILVICDKLQRDSEYVRMAQEAYGRIPDPFVLTRALSAYQRTLFSGDSDYDRYTFQGKKYAMSPAALRGKALFESERLGCTHCHSGFLFTDQSFANNGLYENYADIGRMRLTGLESDRGVFKVPSLRNVARTAPYMHDGSLPTLEKVLEHYQTGGKNNANKSPLIQPFALSNTEKSDLIVFLKALSEN